MESALPRLRDPQPFISRVIGALFMLGGVLGAVSLLLPHLPGDEAALWASALGAAVVGAALILGASAVPLWMLHLMVAGASVQICVSTYLSGIATGVYSTMFVWVVLFTAYFFSRKWAFAHLVWLLACYAVTLAVLGSSPGYSPFTRWLLVAFALAVASFVTSYLVARSERAERRTQRFFNLSLDMLCTAGPDGYLAEVNPAWTETLGYSPEEMRSRPFVEFVHPDDRGRTEAEAERLFAGDEGIRFENRWLAKDGSWHWLLWSATLSGDDGLVYARATDNTERKRIELEREELIAKVESLARTDELTGLPNRRSLAENLEREMARARRDGASLFVAMLDLDRFKAFNDAHGHVQGDALLRTVAQRWDSLLRGSDFVARFGGEEFAVVLSGCTPGDAALVVERLRADTPMGQTCSAGVTSWNPADTAEDLLDRADAALYEAKQAGRDRLVVRA
jgi:diguanylate cyclase (GGDEF)-like protein/PAS domain S-box-containing protein